MGRAAVAHRLLTTLASYTPGLDDQHVTGHLFVDRSEWFALDRHAQLLQSMHGNRDGRAADVVATRGPTGEPTAHNRLTATWPSVLHFNGGAKGEFDRFRDHLLSAARCNPTRSAMVDTPTGTLSFQHICPRHPLPKPLVGLPVCS